jgi:hypothetical protein
MKTVSGYTAIESLEEPDDLDEEDRQIAEGRAERDAWETVRTQQAVSFSERLPSTVDWDINRWLMRNPDWRVVTAGEANTRADLIELRGHGVGSRDLQAAPGGLDER